jgi:hypothetical protein
MQMMCDFREWVHKYQELNKELLDDVRSELQRSLLLPPYGQTLHLGMHSHQVSGALEAFERAHNRVHLPQLSV